MKIRINNQEYTAQNDQLEMPLLWYLREELKLKGTKYGCGAGQCGACTVHFDGNAVRSCVIPVKAAEGKTVTTIEGLSTPSGLHPVQLAWQSENVPQCGYCQSGQIMSAVALLDSGTPISDKTISEYMQNICRCGTYTRIRRAIKLASESTN